MKKVTKENIEWHDIQNRYPITMNRVLIETNDGVFFGYYNKALEKWYSLHDGSAWGRSLNSDTHVYYWADSPKGIRGKF